MKHLKRVCCCLVAALVVVTCVCAGCGSAQSVPPGNSSAKSSQAVPGEQADWKDPHHITVLTRDEFLDQFMTLQHVSPSEAVQLDTQSRTTFETEYPQVTSAIADGAGHYLYLNVHT